MRWPHFLRSGIITSAGNLLGSVTCRSQHKRVTNSYSLYGQTGSGNITKPTAAAGAAAAAAAAGCEAPEREVTYICVYSERDAAEETISRISL